eukprot:4704605-Ditylum_brightwellii.AAC.1
MYSTLRQCLQPKDRSGLTQVDPHHAVVANNNHTYINLQANSMERPLSPTSKFLLGSTKR